MNLGGRLIRPVFLSPAKRKKFMKSLRTLIKTKSKWRTSELTGEQRIIRRNVARFDYEARRRRNNANYVPRANRPKQTVEQKRAKARARYAAKKLQVLAAEVRPLTDEQREQRNRTRNRNSPLLHEVRQINRERKKNCRSATIEEKEKKKKKKRG